MLVLIATITYQYDLFVDRQPWACQCIGRRGSPMCPTTCHYHRTAQVSLSKGRGGIIDTVCQRALSMPTPNTSYET